MNTTEVIEQSAPDTIPQYTLETLPELLPQQARMLEYIMEGYNYTQAYKKAGYTDSEFSNRSAWNLVNRNPLKAHVDYFVHNLSKRITPEYIKGKLNQIAENCINPDSHLPDNDTAIKALAEINKMQGNYAATQVNVAQVTTSIEDIRRAKSEYIKDK